MRTLSIKRAPVVKVVPLPVPREVVVRDPVAAPAETETVASLATEVRLLRARVEALEQIVKQLSQPAVPVRPVPMQ
jgi:hypothetical protein